MTNELARRYLTPWRVLVIGGALALLLAACASRRDLEAKDAEIARLQAEVQTLQQNTAELQRDARFWQQLTTFFQPVEMPSMTDHRAVMLPNGLILALHFDSMDLNQAQNLNWVALGFPGKFCKEDQERFQSLYGPGLTHFHDLKNDTHGGHLAPRECGSSTSRCAVSRLHGGRCSRASTPTSCPRRPQSADPGS